MKLTPAGRFVAFLLIAAIVFGGAFAGWKYFAPVDTDNGVESESMQSNEVVDKKPSQKPVKAADDIKDKGQNDSSSDVINLSLDEWIG